MTAGPPSPRHVVLLGLMGSGKSTVGLALAHQLGWHLNDSDEQIQLSTGRTVRELRDEVGVDEMHRVEAEHLLSALVRPEPSIVCAAASVVDNPRCRKALSTPSVVTIWLRATPDTLARRFPNNDHRPAYGDDPRSFLAEQASVRSSLFAGVSNVVIDVDDRSITDIVDLVWSSLGAFGIQVSRPGSGSC